MKQRLFSLLLLLMCPWVQAQTAKPAVASLMASPGVCVIEDDAELCQMKVSILWETPQEGNYCLWMAAQPEPLQCWSNAWTGIYALEFRSNRNIEFRLSRELDASLVTQLEIRVIGELEQRIRARRRSGFWRVF